MTPIKKYLHWKSKKKTNMQAQRPIRHDFMTIWGQNNLHKYPKPISQLKTSVKAIVVSPRLAVIFKVALSITYGFQTVGPGVQAHIILPGAHQTNHVSSRHDQPAVWVSNSAHRLRVSPISIRLFTTATVQSRSFSGGHRNSLSEETVNETAPNFLKMSRL